MECENELSLKKRTKRRYNLHYRARKQGYSISARGKTVYIPYADQKISKTVAKLKNEYNYVLQLSISK